MVVFSQRPYSTLYGILPFISPEVSLIIDVHQNYLKEYVKCRFLGAISGVYDSLCLRKNNQTHFSNMLLSGTDHLSLSSSTTDPYVEF